MASSEWRMASSERGALAPVLRSEYHAEKREFCKSLNLFRPSSFDIRYSPFATRYSLLAIQKAPPRSLRSAGAGRGVCARLSGGRRDAFDERALPRRSRMPGGLGVSPVGLSLRRPPLFRLPLFHGASGAVLGSLQAAATAATRKPMLLFRFDGALLLRRAERQFEAPLFQLPPRCTRAEPCPVIRMGQRSEVRGRTHLIPRCKRSGTPLNHRTHRKNHGFSFRVSRG
jgi:hypothetical protein